MTNTLHRFGTAESFRDDYVVFAMPARGINEEGAPEKLQRFLRICLRHGPINIGDGTKGGIYRASARITPLVHWRRRGGADPETVVRGIDGCTTAAAVYDCPERVEALLRELKAADLGISVNIAGLTEEARACCQRAGLTRHSIEYSLGFHGDLNRLPDRHVLGLSTMCGHGMVSHNFAKKMIDWVKEGRRDPQQAAAALARFCTCGVYNTTRAARILEDARPGR